MISPIKEINPLLPYVISYPIRENISNILVCHTQKVVHQLFSRVSQCILQEKTPPTLPILQDLVREAPPHAKGTTPSKYLGLQTDGEFVKGSACWPQQPPSLLCQRRRSKWLVSLNRGSTNSCSSGNAGPVWTYQEFKETVNGNSLSSYLILYL